MVKGLLGIMAFLWGLLPVLASAGERTIIPSQSWDRHYNLYIIIMAVIWVGVTVPLIYFSFRYRRRRKDEEGAHIEGNTFLEIVWTAVPLIIVLLLGVQTWAVFKEFREVPKAAYEVDVEGFMWGWNVRYPEGITTTNELRVPVGTPVKVNLTAKDVLHAFFIPQYHIQEEAIPGRSTYLWFMPTEKGEFPAYCTEFCGNGHSLMLAKVIAMEKDEFSAWQAQYKKASAGLSPADKGKKLIQDLGCLGCHSLTGEPSAGPSFRGIYGRQTVLADGKKVVADDEYIEHAI
ncbi:MAG: cytochrome c oxidase subunit II, partial [Thermodesulfovibrionales bacterium]